MADTNLTFVIDEKTRDRIKEIAEINYRSISGQLRLVVEEFVESYDKQNRRKEDKPTR